MEKFSHHCLSLEKHDFISFVFKLNIFPYYPCKVYLHFYINKNQLNQ
jgi:hypothetical protein